MKWHLCILFLIVFCNNVYSQEIVKESQIMINQSALNQYQYKKTATSGWYHYISEAANAGVAWTRITNASLFPDTLVLQRYGGGANASLGRVGTHSVGQVFDPKDLIYSNSQVLSKFNPYYWDSLAVMFRYSHNMPGTKDTLLFCIYAGSGITLTSLQSSGRKVATVSYDKANNQGLKPFATVKVLIDEKDTTEFNNTADYNIKTIAIPGRPFIGQDSLLAFTMSFIPGYVYKDGDTLQQDWEPAPSRKLNHLVYAAWRDNNKLLNTGYNNGLKAITASRYSNSVWNDRYIPGLAWNDFDEQVNAYFHISSENVGIRESASKIEIYPNPVKTGGIISLKNVNNTADYFITDLRGGVLTSGSCEDGYLPVNLTQGVYLMKIINNKTNTFYRLIVQ